MSKQASIEANNRLNEQVVNQLLAMSPHIRKAILKRVGDKIEGIVKPLDPNDESDDVEAFVNSIVAVAIVAGYAHISKRIWEQE